MARIRTIKPEIWSDPDFVERSTNARLLFVAALNFASDWGVLADKPLQLKMQCFPGDNVDIGVLVDELVDSGLWLRRVAPDGAPVLIIRTFTRHQRVDKPNKGDRWGDPAEWPNQPDSTNDPRAFDEHSKNVPGTVCESSTNVLGGKGMEGNGREWKGSSTQVSSNTQQEPIGGSDGWLENIVTAESILKACGTRNPKPTLDELAATRELLNKGWTPKTLEAKAVELAAKADRNPRRYVFTSLDRAEPPPPPPTRRCPDCRGDIEHTSAGITRPDCSTCGSTGKVPLYDRATS
jgi:hypothetical protein